MRIKLILFSMVLILVNMGLVNSDFIDKQSHSISISVLQPFNQTSFDVFLSNQNNNVTLSLQNYSPVNYTIIFDNFSNDNFTVQEGNNTFYFNYNISESINETIEVTRI